MSSNNDRSDSQSESAEQLTYELVCIGFGTTALPLAAALAERNPRARVLFIERENQFHWQRGNVLPDKPIGTNFLRDLATTQNPRSAFTFVNFLHATGQLIQFTNNSKMKPSRRLMANYFRWAADKIEQLDWVSYGQEAVHIRPVKGGSQIGHWSVELRNSKTQAESTVLAKRVVLATGANPHIPQALNEAPQVLHANNSDQLLESLRMAKDALHIAVIGADQEAAELFEHISTLRGTKHSATMFLSDVALRPKEDVTSFQDMQNKPESMSSHLPLEDNQHEPRVDLHTIESLYEAQYTQKIHERDPSKWRFQIRGSSDVIGVEREQGKSQKTRLVLKDPRTGAISTTADAFDVLIAATGYTFAIDQDLINIPAASIDGGALSVDREYRIRFRRDALEPGCGMWLIGSLGGDDFSYMAETANRVATSILRDLAASGVEEKELEHGAEDVKWSSNVPMVTLAKLEMKKRQNIP